MNKKVEGLVTQSEDEYGSLTTAYGTLSKALDLYKSDNDRLEKDNKQWESLCGDIKHNNKIKFDSIREKVEMLIETNNRIYSEKVFIEPTKEQWGCIHKLFKDNNLNLSAVGGSLGRKIMNGINKELKEILKEIGANDE